MLGIVSAAARIHPIWVPLVALAAAIGVGLFPVLLTPSRVGIIAQARGGALLCARTAFVWAALAPVQTVLQPEKL